MSENANFFNSFQVSKPEMTLLTAGEHRVRILSIRMTDADHKLDGNVKDNPKPWVDVHQQLAVTFGAIKGGLITNRFNSKGFERYDELTDAQRASGLFQNIEGFACTQNKKGQLQRAESVAKTTECINIINKFAASLGVAEGESLLESIDAAIADKRELVIIVKADSYKGKDQVVVSGYKKVADVTASKEDDYSA